MFVYTYYAVCICMHVYRRMCVVDILLSWTTIVVHSRDDKPQNNISQKPASVFPDEYGVVSVWQNMYVSPNKLSDQLEIFSKKVATEF